ncbi:unnamed protein product [Caenorhabditis brenneri]
MSSNTGASSTSSTIDATPMPSVRNRISLFESGIPEVEKPSRKFEPVEPRCSVAKTQKMLENLRNWHGETETVDRNSSTVSKSMMKQNDGFKNALQSTSPSAFRSGAAVVRGEVGRTKNADSLETGTHIEPDGVKLHSTSPSVFRSGNAVVRGEVGGTNIAHSLETGTHIEPDGVKLHSTSRGIHRSRYANVGEEGRQADIAVVESLGTGTQVDLDRVELHSSSPGYLCTDLHGVREEEGQADFADVTSLGTGTQVEPDRVEFHSTSPRYRSELDHLREVMRRVGVTDVSSLETRAQSEPVDVELSRSNGHPSVSAETPQQDQNGLEILSRYPEIEKMVIEEYDYFNFSEDEEEEGEEQKYEVRQEEDKRGEENDVEQLERVEVVEAPKLFWPPREVILIAQAALHVRISSKALAQGLPTHLKTRGSNLGRNFLDSDEKGENPLAQLSTIAARILPCHEVFCLECEKVMVTWNPRNPNFAGLLLKCLNDFKPFITLIDFKSDLILKIKTWRKEDRSLHKALEEFEVIMGIPEGEAKHQMEKAKRVELSTLIDQTIHTFRAYKYLMGKYSEMLFEGEEKQKAERAVRELEEIIKKMEPKMTFPTLEEVEMLNKKSNGKFEGFKMGKVLIAHGSVRIIKKDGTQHRYLALQNNKLWICRIKMNLMFNTDNSFDMEKSKYIELGNIILLSDEDEEGRHILKISDKRSLKTYKVLFSNPFERCEWDSKFRYALETFKPSQARAFMPSFTSPSFST